MNLARVVSSAFDARVPFVYAPEDWGRGYTELPDRRGDSCRLPPVSLTAAVITDIDGRFAHVGRVNAVAVELKQYGKKQPGSVVVTERRGTEGADELVVSIHQANTDGVVD